LTVQPVNLGFPIAFMGVLDGFVEQRQLCACGARPMARFGIRDSQ
jgi:hypothetical protein